MTDPIADMLNRIRNAQTVSHLTVEVPFSNLKYEIAKILEENGFIEKVEKKGRKTKRTIEIVLKYHDKTPAILGLKRVSKPGQRIYLDSTQIKKVKDGYGMAIISTSKGKGLMTDKEARKQKIGGEVICEVW
jgi:small subunit ribosomal protein S8